MIQRHNVLGVSDYGTWRRLEEFRVDNQCYVLLVFSKSPSAKDTLVGHVSRTCRLLHLKRGDC